MKKILLISGPTREKIDDIRYITNISSGKTGTYLADFFSECGHEVFQLYGEGSKYSQLCSEFLSFNSFIDLESKTKKILDTQYFDFVIVCAAISDYSANKLVINDKEYNLGDFSKVPSGENFSIKFSKNPKLISSLKKYSKNSSIKLIAFKLTSHASENEIQAAVNKIFDSSDVDYLVQNDLSNISESQHQGIIFDNKETVTNFMIKKEMAIELNKLLESK